MLQSKQVVGNRNLIKLLLLNISVKFISSFFHLSLGNSVMRLKYPVPFSHSLATLLQSFPNLKFVFFL